MTALRACPGCGDRRILLPAAHGERLCVDCRDHPQCRLFGREATFEDLELHADTAIETSISVTGIKAPGCRCDRPLTDDDGDCVRCRRWAAA